MFIRSSVCWWTIQSVPLAKHLIAVLGPSSAEVRVSAGSPAIWKKIPVRTSALSFGAKLAVFESVVTNCRLVTANVAGALNVLLVASP
jgi:hypothetical protein